MSAIQALDDVVANQQNGMTSYMSSTDDERGVDLDVRHRKVHYEVDPRRQAVQLNGGDRVQVDI